MSLLRPTLIALSRNRALQNAIVRVPLTRRMARRFVAGEALQDAVATVLSLNAQGMAATAAGLAGRRVRWHFVGTLQRNKVNAVLEHASVVHSIDRLPLAEAIAKRATTPIDVLVQVNIGQEPQKGGVAPAEAVDLACRVATLPGLRLTGLMAIPPADVEPRPYFEELARLAETLRRTPEGAGAVELSMGMSDDFETAIRCGATIVRVGTALFGPRSTKGREE